MKTKIIVNITIIILALSAICINTFYEDYKFIGIVCIVGIGVLAILKDMKKD